MSVRLVWLAGYGGPYPGSSIPLLRAALDEARERGWSAAAVFGPEARERQWFAQLRSDGYAAETTTTPYRRIGEILAEDSASTILHTHYSRFDVAAALQSLKARRPRPPVFWHVRTALGTSVTARIRNSTRFGLLGRSVDGILTPSADLRDQVVSRGAPRAKVHVLPHGLDTDRFSLCTANERATARRELDLDETATVLLHFGWDWHRKGGDLFLDAVRRVGADPRCKGREIVALINQGGEEAQALASRLGISDQVRLLGATDRVESLHAAADVMLATSRAEGGMPPFAVAEALSRGTPVVATSLPDHAFAAERSPACRLADFDGAAIAEAVVGTLARPPDQAEEEAAQGSAWIAREKSMSAWAARMFHFYEEALAYRGHPRSG